MEFRDRIALIDGDEVAYTVALKWQDKLYVVKRGDKEIYSYRSKIEAVEAIENETDLTIEARTMGSLSHLSKSQRVIKFNAELDDRIFNIRRRADAPEYKVFLSSPEIFRTELATLLPYKGSRSDKERPLYLAEVKECMQYRGAIIYDKLEADDAMSIEATTISSEGILTPVICSSDKDLRTVSGLNFNIGKKELTDINPVEAMYNFYYQILVGDVTDNIPSPYMLGDVTAKRILGEVTELGEEEVYNYVLSCYSRYLLSTHKDGTYKTKWFNPETHTVEDVIFEVANLLWMKRNSNVEERWLPPTKRGYTYSY